MLERNGIFIIIQDGKGRTDDDVVNAHALGDALDEMGLAGAEVAAQGQDIAVAEDRPQGFAQSDGVRF